MLIGLHGAADAGKDTAYRYIELWACVRNLPVRRDAFADRMKVSAAKALGYDGTAEQCIAIMDKIKQPGWEIIVVEPSGQIQHPISGRSFVQYYGTEAHRDLFGQRFWIDAVLTHYQADETLVITDVRFPNEAEAIHDLGGEVWRIVRPNTLIAESDHVSEDGLPDAMIDYTIVNDQGLDHLEHLVLERLRTRAVQVSLVH